jgi:hypothetical protein
VLNSVRFPVLHMLDCTGETRADSESVATFDLLLIVSFALRLGAAPSQQSQQQQGQSFEDGRVVVGSYDNSSGAPVHLTLQRA